jgi:hypothetical protein
MRANQNDRIFQKGDLILWCPVIRGFEGHQNHDPLIVIEAVGSSAGKFWNNNYKCWSFQLSRCFTVSSFDISSLS